MNWLTWLIALPLAAILGIAVLNFYTFPHLQPDVPEKTPKIPVLMPARNEADKIAATVRAVLAQNYPDFEVILLDDHSTDETARLAREAAHGNARFRLLRGEPLPAGWLGKNWACQQLAQKASGEWLFFLDADVRLAPGALRSIAAACEESQADLLSIFPRQTTKTLGEKLVVPLINYAVLAYLPVLAAHHAPYASLSAANGQALLFRRTAYERIGGHAAVRDTIIEDMAMARKIKAAGLKLRLVEGGDLISCRMYENWAQVRDGFAKNILAGYGNSPLYLLASTLFHWLLFIVPWGWWLLGGDWRALGLGLGGMLVRAVTARFSQENLLHAVLMPLSVLAMTRIAAQALFWRYAGKGQWKGRRIQLN